MKAEIDGNENILILDGTPEEIAATVKALYNKTETRIKPHKINTRTPKRKYRDWEKICGKPLEEFALNMLLNNRTTKDTINVILNLADEQKALKNNEKKTLYRVLYARLYKNVEIRKHMKNA